MKARGCHFTSTKVAKTSDLALPRLLTIQNTAVYVALWNINWSRSLEKNVILHNHFEYVCSIGLSNSTPRRIYPRKRLTPVHQVMCVSAFVCASFLWAETNSPETDQMPVDQENNNSFLKNKRDIYTPLGCSRQTDRLKSVEM